MQARLRDELQTVCTAAVQENRLPTAYEIINAKTPYLEAVLEETLRLRAAFLIPRDAVRDTAWATGSRKARLCFLFAKDPTSPPRRHLISRATRSRRDSTLVMEARTWRLLIRSVG